MPSALPRNPTFQAATGTSSRMDRACSTMQSPSSVWWSKTSAVSRMTMAVTTGRAWAPMAAMVATSPALPPAPLGSLALKLMTQAGGGDSWSSPGWAPVGSGEAEVGS